MPSKEQTGNSPLGSVHLGASGPFKRVELEMARRTPQEPMLTSNTIKLPNGIMSLPTRGRRGGGAADTCKNLTVTTSRPASVYAAPPEEIPENTVYFWVHIGSVDNVVPVNIFNSFTFDKTSSDTYYVYLECTLAATAFKAETSEIKISTTAPAKTTGVIGGTDTRPEKYNFILAYILEGGVISNMGCGDISTEMYATTTTTGTVTTVAARRLG